MFIFICEVEGKGHLSKYLIPQMDDGGMELRARTYQLHGLMKAADG
jgi:hypothetical protein